MESAKPPVIVIAGPTGSGKSATAELLCDVCSDVSLEIVSADSRQIYRELEIGTDKPDRTARRTYPYHMVDFWEPNRIFSAADYVNRAKPIINEIHARCAVPVITGGTGLYIRALLGGLAEIGGRRVEVREKLQERCRKLGVEMLYQELLQLDPLRAAAISSKDQFRIIRALEVLQAGVKEVSAAYEHHGFNDRPYLSLMFILNISRDNLYKRIEHRVDKMIESGFVDEVRRLLDQFGYDAPALNAIGYRQIGMYLAGEIPVTEAVRLIKRDTRRYAKRQLTWFRKEANAEWLIHDPNNPAITAQVILEKILKFLGTTGNEQYIRQI